MKTILACYAIAIAGVIYMLHDGRIFDAVAVVVGLIAVTCVISVILPDDKR